MNTHTGKSTLPHTGKNPLIPEVATIIHTNPTLTSEDLAIYSEIIHKDYPNWTPADHNFLEVVLTEEEAEALFALTFPALAEL